MEDRDGESSSILGHHIFGSCTLGQFSIGLWDLKGQEEDIQIGVLLSQGSCFSKPLVLPLQPPNVICLDANGELLKVLDWHMATHQWKGLLGATCHAMNKEDFRTTIVILRVFLSYK